ITAAIADDTAGVRRFVSSGAAVPKTRTPPEGEGGVSGTLMVRAVGRARAPLPQTHMRAKSSSRNVRHGRPTRHTFLEASGALTDWTPRAGAGCPRSLARWAQRG